MARRKKYRALKGEETEKKKEVEKLMIREKHDEIEKEVDQAFTHNKNCDASIGAWWPAVDAKETESYYELHVELPGVNKKDVVIELQKEGSEKYLIVSGTKKRAMDHPEEKIEEEKKEEKEGDDDDDDDEVMKENSGKWVKWHRTERVYGCFERAFNVPVETEGDEIKAKFENGVLSVTFPKHEVAPTPAKVSIKII